ncbi:HTH domain-containing protein [Clostridium sp. CCUG 7971]|uniref:helix-turn-helix transcriptional regulator n=1 Tax=Clostridium sp. CCUG 7971 TaxID=2811414 RepID=UPI001ABB165F|nr:HTH domain-containing protein [Clostridium sp. CCUG 7971]MBO3444714.1 HTH domain-containing protein [Clostridium sp. CCUG 7971]
MRLLDILFYLLKNNSKTTIKELSERFKVSTKTIQRDLDKLSVLGIPIITYRGVNGGVDLDRNYIIAKYILTDSDYESLILALYISENISENIKKSFLIDKFTLVDSDRCSRILNNLKEKLIIDLYENKFSTENKICNEINKSLDNKFFVELEIEGSKVEVFPISYVLKKEGLCLYCCDEEYKLILIDKISKAVECKKRYYGTIISYIDNKKIAKFI